MERLRILILIFGLLISCRFNQCQAPSRPPMDITVRAINSTALNITWILPPRDYHNGTLLNLTILYKGIDLDMSARNVIIPITNTNSTSSNSTSANSTSSNSTSVEYYILSNLQEYVNYSISLRIINVIGISPSSDTVFERTLAAIPAATPQNVTTETLSTTSIRIRWYPPPRIDQNGRIIVYNISYTGQLFDTTTQYIYVSTSNVYPAVDPVYLNITGLEEYNNYTISVSAFNTVGASDFTPEVVQITNIAAPSMPPSIITISPGTRSITITWTPPPGIDQNGVIRSYTIFHPSNLFQSTISQQTTYSVPGPTYPADENIVFTIDNLEEFVNYDISILANTVASGPTTTPPMTVVTMQAVPGAPILLIATSNIPTELCISWRIPQQIVQNGLIESYFVNLSTIQNNFARSFIGFTPVYPAPVVDLSTCFNDVEEGLSYTVSVRAVNGAGMGASSNSRSVTTASALPDPNVQPFDPADVNVTFPSPTSFSLALPIIPETILNGPLTGYVCVYQGSLSLASLTGSSRRRRSDDIVAMTDILTQNFPADSQTITLGDILPNYNYVVDVSASTSAGQTPSVRIMPSPLPAIGPSGPPISIALTVLSPTMIRINWVNDFTTLNGPLVRFNIFYRIPHKSTSTRIQFTPTDVVGPFNETITELMTNQEYVVTINVENSVGQSPNSAELRATTDTNPDTGDSVGAIIGGLIVVIVILAVVIATLTVLMILLIRWRKRKESNDESRIIIPNTIPSIEDQSNQNQISVDSRPNQLRQPVEMKTPVPVEKFAKYIEEMSENDKLKFHEEYMSIPNPSHTTGICSISSNQDKNRYKDIRTYDHSRVILDKLDGDEHSDYINANFMNGYYKKDEYIATQGPLDNTIADFWRMAWDWKVSTVVMLTKCEEIGKRKCSQYWPDNGTTCYSFYDSAGYSNEFVQVTLDQETVYAHYVIRELTFSKVYTPNQQRKIRQWQYTSWTEVGVPENKTSLLKFVQKVHQSHPQDSGPMIVHCSGGAGRTGIFITLGFMMPMIRIQSLVDVYNFVKRMRDCRNRMVQVEDQYVFIHEALLEFIQHGDTEVSGEDLDTYFRKLESEEENGVSKLLTQFKCLSLTVKQTEYSIAQSQENVSKNRYANIIPYNTKRVKLASIGPKSSDYINASYIDGYWMKNAFIATQGPIQSTIEDFWRMVWEQNTHTIVMLTLEVEAGRERCSPYWPKESLECYGQIMVDQLCSRNDDLNDFTVHDFKVTHMKENRSRKVCHYQYTGWQEREMPDSAIGLNNMIGDIDAWQRRVNPAHPIVVHCSAGVGRTGVFIAIYNMLASVRHENTVDVFSTVRTMGYQRPAMVQTATQYRFCYLALIEFLSNSSSLYQNIKI